MIGPFLGWAIESLIASAALMALVLAIRLPVRRAFGPDVAYALWALPVLRLCLPPIPQAVRHAAIAPIAPMAQASEPVTVLLIEPATHAVTAAVHAFSWSALAPVLGAFWLAGAMVFVTWHVIAHARFCRDLLACAETVESIAGDVRLIESTAARGPLAFGVWQRYVAFPADFGDLYDPAERDLALAHELGHHARGDLISNWIALVMLSLHWFNPLAWYAFRAFRTDQEVANDARVLAGRPAITRHTYACAILKAAHGGAVSAACHLHTIDDLKGRLRMLTTIRISRFRLAGGAGTVALLGVAALGLTASGTQAAEHVRVSVKRATGVDIAMLDRVAPLAPVARLAPVAADLPAVGVAQAGAIPAPPATPDVVVVAPNSHRETTNTITDDTVGRRHVVHIKDGTIETDDQFANLPEVSSRNCDDAGAGKPLVLTDDHEGRRRIVICTDRIKVATMQATAMADKGAELERHAYRAALAGLRSARANMANDVGMEADARRQTMAAMDLSIAEIEKDLAKVD